MSQPVPISIALPVYNRAHYLREALDSIQAQTFTDFEIVIFDNTFQMKLWIFARGTPSQTPA